MRKENIVTVPGQAISIGNSDVVLGEINLNENR